MPVNPDAGLVVLRVGGAEFGLSILSVREVLPGAAMSRVPFAPRDVCGVFSLRGEIVPVIDLGLRLFGRAAERPGALVVVGPRGAAEPVALLVDAVPGLVDGRAAVRDAPAEAEASLPAGWVSAVVVPEPGRPITVLDVVSLLAGPRPDPPPGGTHPPPGAEHG
jgi:chemotaxis signal transduction protein